MSVELDLAQVDGIAPFGILCAPDLTIVRAGPALRTALGRDPKGVRLPDVFSADRPRGELTADQIRAREGMPFLLRSRTGDVTLRCQPVVLRADGSILFLGSPAITSDAQMSELGLRYTDFAPSDPTPDLLILKASQERSLQDLSTLNAELERSAVRLKESNAALADAERRYRTIVEHQPLVTYIDRLGSEVVSDFVSENTVELLGYPLDRWGEPGFFFSIVHPEDVDWVRAEHERTSLAGERFRGEFRLMTARGSVVWVHCEDAPVLAEDGTPLYRLGYMLDTTERRTTEESLRETSTRLSALIGSLRTGLLVEDQDRRVALTNSGFCAIFEIPARPEDLVGADCRAAAEQASELTVDPEGFLARIEAILERRAPVREEEIRFRDGRIVERDYTPISVDGDHRGHLWAYRDVTAQRETLRAVQVAYDQAIAASRAKSDFLATVSHEIRSPMHGVLATIDLLARTELDQEQDELVSVVRSSAESLLTVINDILDLQRAESGTIELRLEEFDLGRLVSDVRGLLRPRAESKGLTLHADVSDDLPGVVYGDAGRIRQVVMNLAANAVKFTDAGEVTLRADLLDADATSAGVQITVSDTGIGIPSHQQRRVFEPFAQVDSSSARRHEGTGLGLAITQQLVELMNGAIALESEPGAGTTATVTLRLALGGGAGDGMTGADSASRRPRAMQALTGCVLLAEDSPVNQELARRQLDRLGLSVRTVDSGRQAVAAFEAGEYDIVLMDLRMPGMDGLAATRAIRSRESATESPRVPIIAMTADARPQDRERCLEAGMDDYVTKPLLLDDLDAVLRRWLDVDGAAEGPDAERDIARRIHERMDGLASELGSTDAAARIAAVWLNELRDRLRSLAAAAGAGEAERVRELAHLLKSSLAMVGADDAAELATALEQRARDERAVGVDDVRGLQATARTASSSVEAWSRAQGDGTGVRS